MKSHFTTYKTARKQKLKAARLLCCDAVSQTHTNVIVLYLLHSRYVCKLRIRRHTNAQHQTYIRQ